MFVFVWFIGAAGVLMGGHLLRALGWPEAMGLEGDKQMTIIYVMCAFMIGQGVGEWRGMVYAERTRDSAGPAA